MSYAINNDPYIDPQTGILNNLLGITTQAALDIVEQRETAIRSATFNTTSGVHVAVSLKLICMIHRHLFANIYTWAGKIRTVQISKDDTNFCHVNAIEQYVAEICNELAHDDALSSNQTMIVSARLAHYYSEFNLLHPFREGNGRVIRVLVQEIGRRHGWWVDWSTLDAHTNVTACVAAYHGDERPLAAMLLSMIQRLP